MQSSSPSLAACNKVGNHYDNEETILLAVVEWTDRWSVTDNENDASSSLKKFRVKRKDLFFLEGGEKNGNSSETNNVNSLAPTRNSSSSHSLKYTGQQLYVAILKHVLRSSSSCALECENDCNFLLRSLLSRTKEESCNADGPSVEAYDHSQSAFISLLHPSVREVNVTERFGRRVVRCIVSNLKRVDDNSFFSVTAHNHDYNREQNMNTGCTKYNNDESTPSVTTQNKGHGKEKTQPKQPLLAIMGRYFPYDPNYGISYAGKKLIVKEIPNNPLSDGTAFNVWDGALLLARYLEKRPDKVRSKRILELGSGCGLVGIAAAMLGANEVVLTDLPYALPLLKENVERNRIAISTSGCNRIDCMTCDWFDPPAMSKFEFSSIENPTTTSSTAAAAALHSKLEGSTVSASSSLLSGTPDVILIADCVWLESLVTPLLTTLETYVLSCGGENNVEVLISYQRRGKSTHERFWKGLHSIFDKVTVVDIESMDLVNHCEVLHILECHKTQSRNNDERK